MRARTFISMLALLATTLAPLSIADAAGINLSWDECGSAGMLSKLFACDSDEGAPFELIGSVKAPPGTEAIVSMEIVLDIQICSPTPSWWLFRTTGSCRTNAASASADFVSQPVNACRDYWAGAATGGITNYIAPYGQYAGRSRFLLLYSMPAAFARPMDPDDEYLAFRLRIDRQHSSGVDACAGCSIPAAIVLNEIKLVQTVGLDAYRMQSPSDRNWVLWQSVMGHVSNFCGVPVRNSTWGAIKAQYR